MTKVKVIATFLIIIGLFLLSPLPCFAVNVKIVSSNFLTHWIPGEDITFTVSVKNNDGVINDVYFTAVLTNITTGVEFGSSPSSAGTVISANIISHITATTILATRPPAGIYTVTFILFNSADDAELDRSRGAEPLHVGTGTNTLAAFPKVLDLGTLQYGRFMHPVPIEISWDFFGFSSQLRKDHPWYMRVYTDNHTRYKGVQNAIYSGRVASQLNGSASALGSPAGLISSDGKYVVPLKIWCLNFGPDVEEGWDTNALGPPPVQDDQYWKGILLDNGTRDPSRVPWEWIPDYVDMSADPATWRKLIGQDPYDTHYVSDANPTGDFTLTSPFQAFIAYETSPTAVTGSYSTDLIIEVYTP